MATYRDKYKIRLSARVYKFVEPEMMSQDYVNKQIEYLDKHGLGIKADPSLYVFADNPFRHYHWKGEEIPILMLYIVKILNI